MPSAFARSAPLPRSRRGLEVSPRRPGPLRLRGDPGPRAPARPAHPAVPVCGAGRGGPLGPGALRSRPLRRRPRRAACGLPGAGRFLPRRQTRRSDCQSPTRGRRPHRAPPSKPCGARSHPLPRPPNPTRGPPFQPNRPLNVPSPNPGLSRLACPMPPILDPGAPPRSPLAPPPDRCHVGRLPGPSSQIRGPPWAGVPFPPAGPLPQPRQPAPLCGQAGPGEARPARGHLPGPAVRVPGRRRPPELPRCPPSARCGLVRGWSFTKY